jgi:hypothetical protein
LDNKIDRALLFLLEVEHPTPIIVAGLVWVASNNQVFYSDVMFEYWMNWRQAYIDTDVRHEPDFSAHDSSLFCIGTVHPNPH